MRFPEVRSELAKVSLDVFMGSYANQCEDLVLEGEYEPESQTYSRLPDSTPVDLSNAESGMPMRLSHGLG